MNEFKLLKHGARPAGIKPAQRVTDAHVFNPSANKASSDGYSNRNFSSGRTIPLSAGISERVLPANPRRTMLVLMNYDAANTVFFKFGSAAGLNDGFRLVAGGVALFDVVCPNGDLFLFSSAGISPGVYVDETSLQMRIV